MKVNNRCPHAAVYWKEAIQINHVLPVELQELHIHDLEQNRKQRRQTQWFYMGKNLVPCDL